MKEKEVAGMEGEEVVEGKEAAGEEEVVVDRVEEEVVEVLEVEWGVCRLAISVQQQSYDSA